MDYNGAPLVAVEAQPLMILPDNLPAMEMMTRPERPVHDRRKKRIKDCSQMAAMTRRAWAME